MTPPTEPGMYDSHDYDEVPGDEASRMSAAVRDLHPSVSVRSGIQ